MDHDYMMHVDKADNKAFKLVIPVLIEGDKTNKRVDLEFTINPTTKSYAANWPTETEIAKPATPVASKQGIFAKSKATGQRLVKQKPQLPNRKP